MKTKSPTHSYRVAALASFILALLVVPGRAALFQDNFANTAGNGMWESKPDLKL